MQSRPSRSYRWSLKWTDAKFVYKFIFKIHLESFRNGEHSCGNFRQYFKQLQQEINDWVLLRKSEYARNRASEEAVHQTSTFCWPGDGQSAEILPSILTKNRWWRCSLEWRKEEANVKMKCFGNFILCSQCIWHQGSDCRLLEVFVTSLLCATRVFLSPKTIELISLYLMAFDLVCSFLGILMHFKSCLAFTSVQPASIASLFTSWN